jgi:site-specific DNA-methyltransferase (adenine-specific)
VDRSRGVFLYGGDCLAVMDELLAHYPDGIFDAVFADPPYRLSNGGISCQSGRVVCVDKGAWDRSAGYAADHAWNREWLARCQRLLRPDGTLWVTGSQHSIFSVGHAIRELGMKILNQITWEKPDPPPNLSCRYFTHSTETLIWAAKSERSRHRFNHDVMRSLNHGVPMQTVWRIAPPSFTEKRFGRHPTQKPLDLLYRCILACTAQGDLVLDPFLGSGTTAVAAIVVSRRCAGIEQDPRALALATRRVEHMSQCAAPSGTFPPSCWAAD